MCGKIIMYLSQLSTDSKMFIEIGDETVLKKNTKKEKKLWNIPYDAVW